jgi:class I fructose-bisphosphate aldolase
MTYPNQFKQIPFGNIKQCFEMGAAAVGATIYFGSPDVRRADPVCLRDVRRGPLLRHGHRPLVLHPQQRLQGQRQEHDYHASADLTGQANHLGVTIQADIIKQKLPTNNGGYAALNTGDSSYGKFRKEVYTKLAGCDEKGGGGHPIDLCRYQIINNYMGRVPLINSGGESKGASDLADAVRTAVINKRAGGMGLISGRKAFQRPMKEGAGLLHAIQDVYLDPKVTIA